MRYLSFRHIAATAALLSACSSPDSRKSADRAAPSPDTQRVASSDGTLGSGTTRDSVTDRADRGRILGDSTASVWIVMASDFQCPWCKRWHDETFQPIVQNYVRTGKVRMAYLNFPLGMHRNAVPASEAAMCASVQGRFWPMHDALFAEQEKWGELPDAVPTFDAMATRAGVAMPAWRDCMSKHSTMNLIAADRDRARSAGVKSTPTFFVGDRRVEGALPFAGFRDTIEAVLRKTPTATGAPKSP